MRISQVRVTPIAFRDPPLLNAAGIHEPYALRSIIEVETDCFAAVGADLADDFVELLDAAGTERDGKAMCGQLDCGGFADSGRSAGDDGGSALG